MASLSPNHVIAAVAPETTRVESLDWVVIPSIVLLSLTIAGALMILGSMAWLEYRGRPATTRTRLVQALVLSDLVLGIVGLIGNAMEISPGHRLVAGTATCDGLGFMLIAVLWTEHVWTLCLAIGTYLILIHPLHTLTLVLEKHWIWLWGFVWVSAIVIAVITQTLYGFTPSGGICYYPQSAGLYGELMQFIPRAVVFICITLLYARLYVFLKRPDKIRSPYSNSPTGGASYDSSYGKRKMTGFLRKLSGGEKGTPAAAETPNAGQGHGHGQGNGNGNGNGVGVVDFGNPNLDPAVKEKTEEEKKIEPPYNRDNRPSIELDNTGFNDTTFRPPSAPVSPFSEIPPWERLELPVFQIDGQRYGGPSTSSREKDASTMFGGWKGMSGRKRPSTATSTNSNPTTPGPGSGPGMPMPFPARSSISHTTNNNGMNRRRDHGSEGTDVEGGGSSRSRQPSSDTTLVNERADKERIRKTSMMTTTSNTSSNNNLHAFAVSQSQVQNNGYGHGHAGRRPSAVPPHASPVIEDNEDFLKSKSDRADLDQEEREREREEEDDEEESDGEMDLMRMLAQDSEPEDRPTGREEYELVPESMASYLNRKTALLMLWFPLGYVMLFSISLIRVIYDFAGQPPTVLRAMSRWFVFAQGVLDAVIYGLVEWHTKRVVRRRLRKGAMTPGGSRTGGGSFGNVMGQGSAIGSALRAMNFKKSKSGGDPTQSHLSKSSKRGQGQSSQVGSRSQSGSSTPVPPPRHGHGQQGYPSILQELRFVGEDADTPRKGSWATSEGKEVDLSRAGQGHGQGQ